MTGPEDASPPTMSGCPTRGLNVAPGSMITVRGADWIVTDVKQTRDGLLVEATSLPEVVRNSGSTFNENLAGVAPESVEVEQEAPGVELGESVIEQLFRKRFIERAEALGGHVTEIPSDWGLKVEVRFPYDGRIWMLRPQVPLGMTQPDFILEAFGRSAEPIAIYTDGRRWHAHPDSNKLREDSEKRCGARGLGYRVLAVTWSDLHDRPLGEWWFDRSWTERVAPTYGIPTAQLSRLTDDPLTSLMQWMTSPDDERSRRAAIARALPLMARGTTTVASVSGDADSSSTLR